MKSSTSPALFKYTRAESASMILCDNSLSFTCPLEFNDPMDVRTNICHGVVDEQALFAVFCKKFLDAVMADAYKPIKNVGSSLVTKVDHWRAERSSKGYTRQEMQQQINWKEYREGTQKLTSPDNAVDHNWISRLEETRICCLTELHPDDPEDGSHSQLMWSHYADEHAGVAIEFRFEDDWRSRLLEVDYKTTVPISISEESVADYLIATRDSAFIDLSDQTLFGTKSECWSYENEWRLGIVNVQEEGPRFLHFEPECVRSIYFGHRCKPEHRNRIERLAGRYPNADLWQTHIEPGTFKLKAERYSSEKNRG